MLNSNRFNVSFLHGQDNPPLQFCWGAAGAPAQGKAKAMSPAWMLACNLADQVKNAISAADVSVNVSELLCHGSWTSPRDMRSLRRSTDRVVECLSHATSKGQLVTRAQKCGALLQIARSGLGQPNLAADIRMKLQREYDALLSELNDRLVSILFSDVPDGVSFCVCIHVPVSACVPFNLPCILVRPPSMRSLVCVTLVWYHSDFTCIYSANCAS